MGEMHEATVLYHAELLMQLTSGSDRLEEWLVLRCEQLHILAMVALDQLAEQAVDSLTASRPPSILSDSAQYQA